ncbi:MAG: SDR family NAD(P)-dependent oxidoreductase [Planctomycetota bacterium]
MESGLKDKTVIVTGASGGIGAEVVRQFIAEGANVVIHYFSGGERAENLAGELKSEGVDPDRLRTKGADLRDEAAVAQLFDAAEAMFGTVDVLVANAGKWPEPDETVGELPLARWNEVIANNLTSAFLCLREFMYRSKEHNMVNPSAVLIGSTAGDVGEAGHSDYASAKSGLMYGLVNSAKNEIVRFAPRGRVNAVCPGWTMTPMARKLASDESAMKRALQTIALRKFGSPRDVANAVVFLASSDLAGHITGETLFVSGGMEGRVLHQPDEIDVRAALP